jgi:2-polyprenyl-6-methoxyphenol hydroxylase-like FAD-dependent oxidoreductase
VYRVGSNGASQAILDAHALADRLASAEHPFAALTAYEEERLPMTAQIVRMNRRGGPEGVIDVVEDLAPDGFARIDDVLSFDERQAIVRGYASTAGFAKEQANRAAVVKRRRQPLRSHPFASADHLHTYRTGDFRQLLPTIIFWHPYCR